MKTSLLLASLAFVFSAAGSAQAAEDYNRPPAGNAQYKQCLTYSATVYEGGNEASPIKGQTKAQAWCTCMWNETPEDFKGNLVKFSETRKGKETNKLCEKHSDWSE